MKKKKIIFVIPDMAGGGTEKVISLLADEYIKEGLEVGILLFAGNDIAYPLSPEVEVYSAGSPSHGNIGVRLKRLKKMKKYFQKNRDAYIFSFSTIGTGFIVLSTLFHKRLMLVSERTDPQTCNHKQYRNFFYRFSRVLVCQTEDAVHCFPHYLNKKAVVIANPIDPLLPEVYKGERSKRIVTVGRLQPVKNQKMLINAYAVLEKKHPDYTLHLYGKGDLEEELKAQAAELGLKEKVIFHGFCQNVAEETADAGMFVLSSNYEGISNSLVEALAMGTPVIATDCPIGGSRSYINDRENGLLIAVGDTDALIKAMEEIIEAPELACKMKQSAVKVREMFAVEKIAKQMLKTLEE